VLQPVTLSSMGQFSLEGQRGESADTISQGVLRIVLVEEGAHRQSAPQYLLLPVVTIQVYRIPIAHRDESTATDGHQRRRPENSAGAFS